MPTEEHTFSYLFSISYLLLPFQTFDVQNPTWVQCSRHCHSDLGSTSFNSTSIRLTPHCGMRPSQADAKRKALLKRSGSLPRAALARRFSNERVCVVDHFADLIAGYPCRYIMADAPVRVSFQTKKLIRRHSLCDFQSDFSAVFLKRRDSADDCRSSARRLGALQFHCH